MMTIGDKFPEFALKAVKPGADGLDLKTAFTDITAASDAGNGRWCSSGRRTSPSSVRPRSSPSASVAGDFADRDAVVYGVSVDSEFVHLNWRLHHDDLRNLPIPMLADIKRELAEACGVLEQNEGVALRATFIVDPDGVIRFAAVNDLSVGRNPAEVLRVLDALQTDELCPCNWNKGEQFLRPAA